MTPHEQRRLQAAYDEWTVTHPHLPHAFRPIRRNEPEAGTYGYECESPAPETPRWQRFVRWGVIGAGTLAAMYGALWAFCVAAGWVGRWR